MPAGRQLTFRNLWITMQAATKLIITPEFDAWLSCVRDRQAATAIAGRLNRARLGNLGHWRPIGEGVSEMKIDVGKGYRVYFTQRGNILVIIL